MTSPRRRHRKSSGPKDRLFEAGIILASELSLPVVLQRVVDLACEITDARYGALGVLDESGRLVEFVTSGITQSQREAMGPLPRGQGILGVLVEDARPLRLSRISGDPRSVGFPPEHPPMESFLGAPLLAVGRVFGNVYLTEKRSAREFTQEDEDALVALASQAGVAVANAVLYEESRRRQRWLEGLREITTAVMAGSGWDDLLELLVQRARELAGADLAAVAVPREEDGERLWVAAASGMRAEQLRGVEVPGPRSVSIMADVMRSRESVVLDNVDHNQRVAALPGEVGPALMAPLRVHGRAFGTLTVANRSGGRRFGVESLDLLETFADQASVALEYARAHQRLQRLTVLEERERIAKELHDGIIQSLFAVGMELQAASTLTDVQTAARVERAVAEIDRSIRDLRNYIFGLRPGILADRHLGQAVQDLAEELHRQAGVEVRCDLDAHVVAELSSTSTDIIQLVREALSNVARHAAAQRCLIALRPGARGALLTIRDDGGGFASGERNAGQGLRNMRDRVRRLGGRMRVTTAPGRGTCLTFNLPK
jgi:signal transduction histidine kinase